ncbi:MAG: hypothetical protein Q8R16_04315, partial [bacterium]|nr:hypothetical protein [bacterium]
HGIKELPVLHAKTGPEIFRCRVLMRPWWVGGEVVSAHCCAVPQGCYKVHGMVDMAVLPVRFA